MYASTILHVILLGCALTQRFHVVLKLLSHRPWSMFYSNVTFVLRFDSISSWKCKTPHPLSTHDSHAYQLPHHRSALQLTPYSTTRSCFYNEGVRLSVALYRGLRNGWFSMLLKLRKILWKYSPHGLLISTVDGLSKPHGLLYVFSHRTLECHSPQTDLRQMSPHGKLLEI